MLVHNHANVVHFIHDIIFFVVLLLDLSVNKCIIFMIDEQLGVPKLSQ